ncbi:MAG: biotin carboxylase [Planctomyces sp.]|nr:biotin carboxylase [Planctomyces sp.]
MSLTIAVSGLNRGENPQPGAAIIQSLRREFDDVKIVGLVYEVMESGIYADNCADVIYQLPYPGKGTAAFLDRLDHICESHPIDVFIPTLDAEMDGILRIEEKLIERGIKVMLPARESYVNSKKQALSKLAAECGCRIPRTCQAIETKALMTAVDVIGFPIIIKGPFYGADKVQSRETLVEKFNTIIRDWGGPVILQECIKGKEYNVIAVGDGKGEVEGCCAIRKTVVSEKGKGYGGVTIRDNKLDEISRGIIKHLKWNGPLELEYIRDDATGEFLLIEINPRFPAWVDFPSQIGCNLPVKVVQKLMNLESPAIPACEAGKFFVRHSIDLVGDLAQLEQLSILGELVTGQATSGETKTEQACEGAQLERINGKDVRNPRKVNGHSNREVTSL